MPTLFKYAAFYGSIQIIQYLKYNKVPLIPSLWIYAVHSNNAKIIRFLEENKVSHSFDKVLIESIKCHHNSISNYIKDNFYEQNQEDDDNYFNDNFGEFVL